MQAFQVNYYKGLFLTLPKLRLICKHWYAEQCCLRWLSVVAAPNDINHTHCSKVTSKGSRSELCISEMFKTQNFFFFCTAVFSDPFPNIQGLLWRAVSFRHCFSYLENTKEKKKRKRKLQKQGQLCLIYAPDRSHFLKNLNVKCFITWSE